MNCFRYIYLLLVTLYPNLVLAQSSDAAADVRELMESRDQKIKQLLDNEGTNNSTNQRDELKDIVNGTIEREELINIEINNHLEEDLNIKNMDKVFQIIIKSAIFEFLYKPNTSIKIIINEYLKASNFFINDSETKYLNALLDKISKKIRISNE